MELPNERPHIPMSKPEVVETDILIVGGGVAGLAAAIHLADLTAGSDKKPGILVLEKGSSIGSHTLSGAVVDFSTLVALIVYVFIGYLILQAFSYVGPRYYNRDDGGYRD